jgi:hypothetical protein
MDPVVGEQLLQVILGRPQAVRSSGAAGWPMSA